jgi:hypothetical protein
MIHTSQSASASQAKKDALSAETKANAQPFQIGDSSFQGETLGQEFNGAGGGAARSGTCRIAIRNTRLVGDTLGVYCEVSHCWH